MAVDRRLVRKLEYAYMDWQWGHKNSGWLTMISIIQEVEGLNQHGKARQSSAKADKGKARPSAREAFQARRKEVRDALNQSLEAQRAREARAAGDGADPDGRVGGGDAHIF